MNIFLKQAAILAISPTFLSPHFANVSYKKFKKLLTDELSPLRNHILAISWTSLTKAMRG